MNIQKLIILVRNRHEIYDHRHPKHSDRVYVHNTWNTIARQLNATVREVKTKWQNLRSNYMREKRKLKKLNPDGALEYKPQISWHYFELLSFLEEPLIHKAKIRDVNFTQPIISNYVNIEYSEENYEMEMEQGNEQDEYDQVPTSSSSSSSNCLQEENKINLRIKLENNGLSNSVESDSLSLQRLRNYSESDEMETNKQRYHIETSPSSRIDYDPDFMFLKSLLPAMKKLGPIENLEFRGEIINLLKRKLETCLY